MSGAHHGPGEIMNREDALNTIDAQDIIADFQGGGGINEEAGDIQHFRRSCLLGRLSKRGSRPFCSHTMLPRKPLEVLLSFLMGC